MKRTIRWYWTPLTPSTDFLSRLLLQTALGRHRLTRHLIRWAPLLAPHDPTALHAALADAERRLEEVTSLLTQERAVWAEKEQAWQARSAAWKQGNWIGQTRQDTGEDDIEKTNNAFETEEEEEDGEFEDLGELFILCANLKQLERDKGRMMEVLAVTTQRQPDYHQEPCNVDDREQSQGDDTGLLAQASSRITELVEEKQVLQGRLDEAFKTISERDMHILHLEESTEDHLQALYIQLAKLQSSLAPAREGYVNGSLEVD
ncbi:hypothetical protein BD324DRAFT_652678 [Kockovaella imperatae]|uniref:Uncharacterized protein n=1 Tax=Kockovaella imperatae TaxID=4999 RepID=A0A1Y1UBV1_9TREE|nr:hypothetical protein BD324DRAFT_652678 [Kockovaella imperatae]ORX34956.1 hypothetical protein BD324DRAFT_652678 [Kockovaella imperatae]